MDHIHPANSKMEQTVPQTAVRKFRTGDNVWYKNYGNGEKWLPGTVQSTGSRNYEIIDGNNMQSRHIDQLRSRLPETTTTPLTTTDSIRQQENTPDETEQHAVLDSLPLENTTTIIDTTPTPFQGPEQTPNRNRPVRTRKAPQRYGDYVMGEELQLCKSIIICQVASNSFFLN
ncbi:uncharacterized protein LOC133332119 [Musca vetustissima]|uniref:uncharacterized protein LOC133332119 n=1 Tax=Musca vetustissima TaxID=27455 RepID=UPI002AB61C08|nr:uncharacterized protein LOC133332119 [Musca vetustissima]